MIKSGVVRFIYQLDADRKLSRPELSALAERLVNAEDPIEASRVRETIVRGVYGPGAMPKIRPRNTDRTKKSNSDDEQGSDAARGSGLQVWVTDVQR